MKRLNELPNANPIDIRNQRFEYLINTLIYAIIWII